MIRIGIVGCGHIGTVHAFALEQLIRADLVRARVVAAHDVEVERAVAVAGLFEDARPVVELDALLDAVDVVWTCTWTAGHRAVVDAAAARGLAIFCEKPLAPDLAAAEGLAAALRERPHQVGLVLRHAPLFRNVADAVASGRYGRPLATVFRDDQYFPIQGFYSSTWRADVAKAGGGTLIEHSIHDLDMLRMILGEPSSVQAWTNCRFGHAGIEDLATVNLRYDDGSVATLVSIWHQILSRESTRRLEVFCEDALLWTADDYLGPLHVQTATGEEVIEGRAPAWMEAFELPEAFAKSLTQYAEPSKEFLDLLAGDPTASGRPSVDVALAAHRLVDAAYRSAADGGRPVDLPGSLGPGAGGPRA